MKIILVFGFIYHHLGIKDFDKEHINPNKINSLKMLKNTRSFHALKEVVGKRAGSETCRVKEKFDVLESASCINLLSKQSLDCWWVWDRLRHASDKLGSPT